MQTEFTEAEKAFMNMLFKMANIVIEMQNGYMDIDCLPFSRNDLYNLAEKLGIEY